MNACGMSLVAMLAAAVVASLPLSAAADCPRSADELSLLAADSNGDGELDLLVRPKPTLVPLTLDDDMAFVFPVPSRVSGFVLTSRDGSYALTQLDPSAPPSGDWVESASGLFVADLKGNGCPSVILQAASGARTFSVGYDDAGNPYLIQQLGSTPGESGDFSGATLVFRDPNLDGRLDLEVSRSGAVDAIYLAQGDGVLKLDPAASALAVWSSFGAAMAANDVELSLRHLTRSGVGLYEGTMRELQAELSLLPARTVDFGVVDADDQAVQLAIIVDPPPPTSGPGFIHYAALSNDKGQWRIESF